MACERDIISVETIEELIEMKERQLYLNQHTNKIWQGANNKWYTYVGKGSERKLVKKNTETDLTNYICDYYKQKEDNPTIKELYTRWIDYKLSTREIGRGTYDRYQCDFKRYFLSTDFCLCHIRTVSEEDIDIFVRKTIASHEITQKAFSNYRTILIGIFKYAKRLHYTNISITSVLGDLDISKRAFKPKSLKLEGEIFTDGEIPKLMSYLNAHQTIENLGLIFAFQSGVRCGELAAIKFSDITDNILHVQRQEILYKSDISGKQVHEVVEYTKTESGNRYIYLPSNAFNTLMCIRWKNKTCEYVMAKDGVRINKTAFNRYLEKACKKCGIPPRTMHKIRRTYGTTLIDNNVEDSLIMSQMGHTNIQTTRKYYYYANRNDEHKREQIENSIIF